jgi:hypothetical protein
MVTFLLKMPKEELDIFSLNLKEHKNLALHIHPTLEIEILGEKYTIPGNIGISPQGTMKVIHTHDSTGKLHIESPYPYQFYLKDVFKIWGKNISSSCIFNYCEDAEHQLDFYVNNLKNDLRENIPLIDGEVIRIVYKRK